MTTDKKQPPDTDRPCLVIRSPSREIRTASYRDGRWFLTRDTVLMDGDVIDWRELPSWDRLAILDRYDEERAEWEAKVEEADERLRQACIDSRESTSRWADELGRLRSQVTALTEERGISSELIENMKRHVDQLLARADRAEKERDEAIEWRRRVADALDCIKDDGTIGDAEYVSSHAFKMRKYAEERDKWHAIYGETAEERDRAIAERDDAVANVAKISERAHEHICGVMVERDRAISERDDLGCQLEALRAVQRDDVADLRTRMEAVERWRAEMEKNMNMTVEEKRALLGWPDHDDEKGGA
jgi:chromosome segregation ATPase